MKRFLLITLIASLLLITVVVSAADNSTVVTGANQPVSSQNNYNEGSLWLSSGSNADIFSDHGALGVGDVVTILVVERSSATRTGQSTNKKSAGVDFADGTGWISPILGAAGTGYSDNFSAQGNLTNSNNVTAQITATVVEILPNGNLRLQGSKLVKQNNDEQKIMISGVARQRDILSNNTVYSYQLADAEVQLIGDGPIDSKQRQGILTQIFNFLF